MNLKFFIALLSTSTFCLSTHSRLKSHQNQQNQAILETTTSQVQQTGRQLNSLGQGWQDCPCAVNFKCPTCGPGGYESQMPVCACMTQPACPNCVMGKILKQYHEKSALIAKRDAKTQNKLALGNFCVIARKYA